MQKGGPGNAVTPFLLEGVYKRPAARPPEEIKTKASKRAKESESNGQKHGVIKIQSLQRIRDAGILKSRRLCAGFHGVRARKRGKEGRNAEGNSSMPTPRAYIRPCIERRKKRPESVLGCQAAKERRKERESQDSVGNNRVHVILNPVATLSY